MNAATLHKQKKRQETQTLKGTIVVLFALLIDFSFRLFPFEKKFLLKTKQLTSKSFPLDHTWSRIIENLVFSFGFLFKVNIILVVKVLYVFRLKTRFVLFMFVKKISAGNDDKISNL